MPIPSDLGDFASDRASVPRHRLPLARKLQGAGEAVLLFLLATAPWAFAGADPFFESALFFGLAILAGLWAAHSIVIGHLRIRGDAISFSLLGLMLLSLVQLLPLPEFLVGIVSPTWADWHARFSPQPVPSWFALSIDPYLTRQFLQRIAMLLLLYTIVRNWLASRESLRRLGWVIAANGTLLAFIAIGQAISTPRNTIYWQFPTEGSVFGPFVCKNHYSDYVNFSLAFAVAAVFMFGTARKREAISAIALGSAAAVLLMVLSLPMSLSRGGVLASAAAAIVFTAWYAIRRDRAKSVAITGAVFGVAVVVAASLMNWGSVEQRFQTVINGHAMDDRIPLWRDAAHLIPKFALFGSGNGTFIRAEPTVRTQGTLVLEYQNVHNEYLEALVEGGPIRLILTLLICYATLRTGVRAANRLFGRSSAPLVHAILFGLLALMVHSIADFGIHLPAIAMLAIVATAHLYAAADDVGYLPTQRGEMIVVPTVATPRQQVVFVGRRSWYVFGAIGVMLIVGGWDSRLRSKAATAADLVNRFPRASVPREESALAWTLFAPHNGASHFALAQVYYEVLLADSRTIHQSLGGGAMLLHPGLVTVPNNPYRDEALKSCTTTLRKSPLFAGAHLIAGLVTTGPERANHFDAARTLNPHDPAGWYLSGLAAYEANQPDQAWDRWQQTLTLSPAYATQIFRVVNREDAARLLAPGANFRPQSLYAAMEVLYPNRRTAADQRRAFLLKIIELVEADAAPSVADQVLAAQSYGELGQHESAVKVWETAIQRAPNDLRLREQVSRYYEAEENYEAALVHLVWIQRFDDNTKPLRDRIDAAVHGQKLTREIEAAQHDPSK